MDPVAFHLGPLVIRWYGIMAACAFLAGLWELHRRRRFAGLSPEQISDIILIAMISGVIGSRIFFVVQFWDQYSGHLLDIVRIDKGGLVYYGGFFFALMNLCIYAVWRKIDVLRVLDLFAPAMALGHVLARIGCFLNGCCYGKVTEAVCGCSYSPLYHPDMGGVLRHPVQLYEAGANLAIFFFLDRLLGKTRKGRIAALYLLCYGMMRIGIEFFRGDHRDFLLGHLTPAQTIGVFLMIPAGLFLLGWSRRFPVDSPETEKSA
jgi:phosphatidylglycerol:prolipoprotein diacylglycerol transferase